jgi:hypothetical protein
MILYWTNKEPTEEGWYWVLKEKGDFREKPIPSIEYVRKYAGRMCIVNWEIPSNAKWAGPIPLPSTPGCFDVEKYYKDDEDETTADR